ncbi:MAG: HAD family hydrolase [Candidatus Bipolaricaulota bacterium]|nr:HAD family hydrolase [Candidatus Bipolaricaulota bacterium]
MARRWDAVIWDFNGTLVNDVDLALRSINTMLARRDLAPVTRDIYRSVFGFPLSNYYRKLGVDVSRETMQGLADEFHEAYLPGLPACALQDGVREILDLATRSGASQFVLSALEEVELRRAIARLGVADRFVAIYGLDHRLGDSKLARGQELFARHGLRAATTLFIGDMDHDAEVASALGVEVALVAQGHQAPQMLRACGCRVFGAFAELRAAIEISLA